MATGILRIQAFAARQSSPVEGVTVTVSGNGFTATRLTDAEGNVVDEWVSGEEPHEIVLDEGSYTLREEIAPELSLIHI